MNKTLLSIALLSLTAIVSFSKPRLVVVVTIDQLTSRNIEAHSPYFGTDGFRKLMQQGTVYTNVSYPYVPIDRASAIATLMTGTSPYYHGIIGNRWLNPTTAQPMACTDDPDHNGVSTIDKASPRHILTSTITDELKAATLGQALVYAIAQRRDAAILLAGHAADAAFWKDSYTGSWCSSTYYIKSAPEWLTAFNTSPERRKKKKTEFEELTELTNLAKLCIEKTGMGNDDTPDILNICLDASATPDKKKKLTWQELQAITYYCVEPTDHLARYRIPTGTVYINRVANLLNLYLGALYGSDRYVDGCSHNQIYLNAKDIEQKRLRLNEILSLSQSFLLQCEGIRNAYTLESLQTSQGKGTEAILRGMNVTVGGHIALDIAPGWKLINEDSQEEYYVDARCLESPLIVYLPGQEGKLITDPVSADRLAATLAAMLHIKAPNACAALPLF